MALVQFSISFSCFLPFLLGVSIFLLSFCFNYLTPEFFLPSLLRALDYLDLSSLLKLALLN